MKRFLPVVVVVTLIVAIVHWFKSEPVSRYALQSAEHENTSKTTEDHDHENAPVYQQNRKTHANVGLSENPQAELQAKKKQLDRLVNQWPKSEKQLIVFINGPEAWPNQKAKPHTPLENLKIKMGALKVIALRELMTKEKNTSDLKRRLRTIAQNAQDPTIARIATAAEDSLDQGRSFFNDFLDSINRMPL